MSLKNMTRIQRIRYCAAVRWTVYIIYLFICAVLINTGRGIHPIYFIPLCICICMNEGEYTSAILGGVCGLVIDQAYGRVFFGFSSIIMIAICVGSTIVFRHYLFKNIANSVIMTAAGVFVYELLDYFFCYAMWNYDGAGHVFSNISIPCIFYTIAISPIAYIALMPIVKRFYPKKEIMAQITMKM